MIRVNVARLREEKEALTRVQKEIESRSDGNSDIENISSIKGIGTLSAACIVSEIGNISQFSSAMKLQSYGGKSPDITSSAGKKYATGVTKIRNPHFRMPFTSLPSPLSCKELRNSMKYSTGR